MFNQLVFPYERSLSPATAFGLKISLNSASFLRCLPCWAPAAARFPSHFSQLHILCLKPCRLRLRWDGEKKGLFGCLLTYKKTIFLARFWGGQFPQFPRNPGSTYITYGDHISNGRAPVQFPVSPWSTSWNQDGLIRCELRSRRSQLCLQSNLSHQYATKSQRPWHGDVE